MCEIQEYIEHGGPFLDGLNLLRAAGDHRTADELQVHVQRPFIPPSARRRLIEALQGYAGQLPPTVSRSGNPSPPPRSREKAVDAPPEVERLRQRGRMLKKREASLHAQLCMIAREEESRERADRLHSIAKQIMEEIEPELDDVYAQLRAWDEEGVAPISDRRRIIDDTVGKMQRRDNLRSRIYRLSGWLDGGKKLSDADQRKYQRELLEKKAELKDIEEALGLA